MVSLPGALPSMGEGWEGVISAAAQVETCNSIPSTAPALARTSEHEGGGTAGLASRCSHQGILRFWNSEVLATLDGVHAAVADELRRITPTQTLPHRWGRVHIRSPVAARTVVPMNNFRSNSS